MKRWILILMLVSFVLALFAGVASLASVSDKVKLSYWMWDPSIRGKYEKAITKFEEGNPNIEVEMTTMEPRDYWTKLRIMAAAGRLPDVFNMSSGYVEEWASKRFLMNLDRYVEEDLNKNNYFTSVFNIVRYPRGTGPIYALPFAWVTPVLYYNKDAFDEANLAYPDKSWTWSDFLNAAIRLTKDKDGDGEIDQWGYWFFGRYAHVEPWIYQNGGRLLEPGRKSFQPNKEALRAVKFLTDLVLKHKVAPPKRFMEGVRQQDVFPRGLSAMWTDGSWNIENTRKIVESKFRWGITKVPRGPDWEEDVAYAWPDNTAISSQTEHSEAAWKLTKFLSGPGLTMDIYMAGKVPAYKPLAKSEAFFEKGKQPAEKGLLLYLGELPMKESFTMGWSEWRGYAGAAGLGLTGAIDKVINGELSFEEAMEETSKYVNKVLGRYYKG